MNVLRKNTFESGGQAWAFDELAEHVLQSGRRGGALEEVQGRAMNNSWAIGRLLEILCAKTVINLGDVKEILEPYSDNEYAVNKG